MKNGRKQKQFCPGQKNRYKGHGFKLIVLKIDWKKREAERLAKLQEEDTLLFRRCGDGRSFVSTCTEGGGFRMAQRVGADGRRESLLV